MVDEVAAGVEFPFSFDEFYLFVDYNRAESDPRYFI